MTGDAQAPQILTDYYRRRAAEAPATPAYYSLTAGNWTPITWADFMRGAEQCARRFAGLGLGAGARLGLMAPTGLDWETLQVGALLCGAAVVGLDAHDQPARLADIVETSGLAGLVVGDAAAYARIPAEACANLSFVLCLNDDPVPPTCRVRWVRRPVFDAFDGTEPASAPTSQSVATIIFTSGSTGAPKGIAYTHAQVCAAVAGILDAFPEITANDRLVCWLPLSNLFQRMINFCAAGRGAQTYFVADPRAIMTHLPTIQPHVFIAVPRFFEKLNEGIEQKLATQPASARKLVAWASAVGERAAQARRAGNAPGLFTRLQLPLAERLVLKRLRAILGGNIRFMVSGSAPFPRWLLERFHALGLLVLEAYGLSENVVPIAINRVTDYEFGTVGRVISGNEVRIADDGKSSCAAPACSVATWVRPGVRLRWMPKASCTPAIWANSPRVDACGSPAANPKYSRPPPAARLRRRPSRRGSSRSRASITSSCSARRARRLSRWSCRRRISWPGWRTRRPWPPGREALRRR